MNEEFVKRICQDNKLGELLSFTEIGSGENHHNMLITTAQKKVVLRYSQHEDHNTLEKEHTILQEVPKGFGPKSFIFATIDTIDYSLQEYIEGDEPTNSPQTIQLFAKRIAEMHKLTSKGTFSFDIHKHFKNHVDHYMKETPAYYDEDHKNILDQVMHKLQEYNQYFIDIPKTLIHQDIILRNTKLNDVLVFIDWEYGDYGDTARDLASFYYKNHDTPWQIGLSAEEEKQFLDTYTTMFAQDRERLEKRIHAWQVFVAINDHYWSRRRLDDYNRPFNGRDTKESYEQDINATWAVINEFLE